MLNNQDFSKILVAIQKDLRVFIKCSYNKKFIIIIISYKGKVNYRNKI